MKKPGTAVLSTLASGAMLAASGTILAQDAPQTLFTNVHVFDGVQEQRIENANVLVEGNLIKTVSTNPIEADGATALNQLICGYYVSDLSLTPSAQFCLLIHGLACIPEPIL